MTDPLRVPVSVGRLSYYAEIHDPEAVLRSCDRPRCPICLNLAHWMQERALEDARARAAAEECGFAVVA